MAEVEYRCFVGGLAWATNDQSLEEAFAPFDEILDSKIINDRETGRSRGFGFVTVKDEKSMRDNIEGMNGQDLDGRNITVNEAQSRGSGGVYHGGVGGGGAVRLDLEVAAVMEVVVVKAAVVVEHMEEVVVVVVVGKGIPAVVEKVVEVGNDRFLVISVVVV